MDGNVGVGTPGHVPGSQGEQLPTNASLDAPGPTVGDCVGASLHHSDVHKQQNSGASYQQLNKANETAQELGSQGEKPPMNPSFDSPGPSVGDSAKLQHPDVHQQQQNTGTSYQQLNEAVVTAQNTVSQGEMTSINSFYIPGSTVGESAGIPRQSHQVVVPEGRRLQGPSTLQTPDVTIHQQPPMNHPFDSQGPTVGDGARLQHPDVHQQHNSGASYQLLTGAVVTADEAGNQAEKPPTDPSFGIPRPTVSESVGIPPQPHQVVLHEGSRLQGLSRLQTPDVQQQQNSGALYYRGPNAVVVTVQQQSTPDGSTGVPPVRDLLNHGVQQQNLGASYQGLNITTVTPQESLQHHTISDRSASIQSGVNLSSPSLNPESGTVEAPSVQNTFHKRTEIAGEVSSQVNDKDGSRLQEPAGNRLANAAENKDDKRSSDSLVDKAQKYDDTLHDDYRTNILQSDQTLANQVSTTTISDQSQSTETFSGIPTEESASVSNTGDVISSWCNFKCKFCQKSFQDRKSWKFHTMDDHGILPYACRYCDDRYEHKYDLKEHERSHRSRYKGQQPSQETTQSEVKETTQSEVKETIELQNVTSNDITKENSCNYGNTLSKKIEQVCEKPSQQPVIQDAGVVTDSKMKETKKSTSIGNTTTGKRKRRPKKQKGSLRSASPLKQKKNVVVVSVFDVIKSDAERLEQQQKGGASGALLNIVDQIRTTTGGKEIDGAKETGMGALRGNIQRRASKEGKLMEETDEEEDLDDDDVDDDDDDDVTYSVSSTYSKIKHKKHKHKDSKRANIKSGKIHKCKICSRVLSSNKVKIYHERGHPYPNECKVCHRAYQNKRDLEDHEEGHRSGRWSCRLCSEVFKDYQSHDIHRKVHLQEEKDSQHFKCQYCSKVMRTKKSLEVHMRVHTGEKPYKCSYCEKSYRHYESWNYHENKHKGTLKQHVCQFCGKAFGGKYGLQVHERIHTGEKPYKCDHCNLAFSSNEKLKVHKDKVSGLAYVCQFCGKEFFTKPNLNQHEMIHKGVKPHKCKICEASFTSSTSLKYHTRTVHTGERYPCQICNKQCKSKGQLTSHLRSHTDERPFQCKYCHKSFRNSNTLKTHERGIHLGYRYKCEICRKDFSQKTALRTHDKLVHQGIKWKDLVLQRKINRERKLAEDVVKGERASVDVKFAPGATPPIGGQVKAQATPEHVELLPAEPEVHQNVASKEQTKHGNKEASKVYQHRMIYHPVHMGSPDPDQSEHISMVPHIAPNLPPIPISVSSTVPVSVSGNDPSVPDVAYQLATFASSARHLLHLRQTQSHSEEGLQVHMPGVAPSDSNVVDVVFPSESGAPMYQTL